jgi:DNA-directed RNA polymerase subunit E'/Rpb7
MIQTHVFTEKVVVPPCQLGDISGTIHQYTRSKVSTCSEQYGYIKSIESVRYGSNMISRTSGDCVFTVTYTANCVKPVIGEVVDCQVIMVFAEGILVTHETMHIIVPGVHQPIGSHIKVEIGSIRYEQSKYQCVAKEAGAGTGNETEEAEEKEPEEEKEQEEQEEKEA